MIKPTRLIMLTLVTLALAACASEAAPQATETMLVEETALLPTATPLPRPSPVVDNCLECHTDKDKLVALAVHEEAGHGSESEGVG